MKYIKVMREYDFRKEYDVDCLDVGVEYVYVGVYDDGEDMEYSDVFGFVFEDGVCQICDENREMKCEFDVMIREIEVNLDNIEKCYK